MPTIHPLKQLCSNLIADQRATLDNMEQLVNTWPDDWKPGATTSAVTAGGARGFSNTQARRARSRARSGGARGTLGAQARTGGVAATHR